MWVVIDVPRLLNEVTSLMEETRATETFEDKRALKPRTVAQSKRALTFTCETNRAGLTLIFAGLGRHTSPSNFIVRSGQIFRFRN